jgi:hypothetical protein
MDTSVNDPAFYYYGTVCVSLSLLGLLLTVREFHRMSPSNNAIDRHNRDRLSGIAMLEGSSVLQWYGTD